MDYEWYAILVAAGGVCAIASWAYLHFVDGRPRTASILVCICCSVLVIVTLYLETLWPIPHRVETLQRFFLTVIAMLAASEWKAWWENRRLRTRS